MKKSLNVFLVLLLILSSVPDITMAENEEVKEEYKLYAEKADDKVSVYPDETLEDELFELEENVSVLVIKEDLETSLEEEHDFVYITLNPEKEEIPEELTDEVEKVEDIQGFVHIDRLVDLEDEEEFIVEREAKGPTSEELVEEETDEAKDPTSEESVKEETDEVENETSEESEPAVEDKVTEEDSEKLEELEEEPESELEKKEDEIEERNSMSMMRSSVKETSTSRLAHIRGGNRLIYETIGGKSESSLKHTNAVYYIKRQAKIGSETYYLLSASPSATRGVIGWMKEKDVSTHSHLGVTKAPKQMTIKGTGKATSKAWGGSKDTVHKSMSRFKDETLHVNLTEKIGNNTWYRGKINGKGTNIWLHTSQTEKLKIKETSTSRLGHVRGGERHIYKTIGGKSIKASSKHRNAVYYIKREAKLGSQAYYLLSTSPSATRGVVGWMKTEDVSTHTHVGVTKTPKQLLIKGTGKATSKAWGGSKDTAHTSMKSFQGDSFSVNLTEKVGNNTWYRGKINSKGANVWLHSSQTEKLKIKETSTSRLGHVRGGKRHIYKTIGGKSIKTSSKHRNAVYYIKREAKLGSQAYYLLSTSPSATRGVVGWMKAEDVSTRTHSGVTKAKKQLTVKGTGKATSKAWGGSKDMVHSSMSRFKGQSFHVNLTEKVGGNTWYRGKINGKGANVWLHSSQTQKLKIKESNTSQLAHIYGGGRLIYKTIGGNSFKATSQYLNAAYYVKREAQVGGQKYYLLSKSPSATRGVVGWMKAEDVSTHTHSGVTKAKKQLVIKGTGKATSKAWGGSKDTVYSSMSRFKGHTLHVNLTEKVGGNTWYRGKIDGKGANVWLHSSQTKAYTTTKTNYGLSLDEALVIQNKPERSPFILNGSHGFIAKSKVDKNNRLKSSSYVRTMPQTGANPDNKIIKTLAKGTKITPLKGGNDYWYVIEVGGSRKVTALSHQIKERLDPKNSINHAVNKFQFLDLRKRTGLTTSEMNRELATRGILRNQGKAFRNASIKHGINEMYLIVHARLETGNGTSALSTGKHEVGLDNKGKPHLVKTTADRIRLKNIKKTYNMFGIGAIDTDPAGGGATRAYTEGWFTPEAAIVGGAAWIKDNYIYNKHKQNTLYKMRWNPNMKNGFAWKQYATDIDWALKQARLIHGVYNHTDKNKSLTFDIPKY